MHHVLSAALGHVTPLTISGGRVALRRDKAFQCAGMALQASLCVGARSVLTSWDVVRVVTRCADHCAAAAPVTSGLPKPVSRAGNLEPIVMPRTTGAIEMQDVI